MENKKATNSKIKSTFTLEGRWERTNELKWFHGIHETILQQLWRNVATNETKWETV